MILAGLITYFTIVGLDEADKVASVIACVLALAALVAPYLLPAPQRPTGRDPDLGTPSQRSAGQGLGIDVRNARGVQINHGGRNTQNNTFFESP
jgi:hypothetical protein